MAIELQYDGIGIGNFLLLKVFFVKLGTCICLRLRKMQAEQRKMLRMMLNISRKVVEGEAPAEDDDEEEEFEMEADDTDGEEQVWLEDWVSWVQRATHIAEVELEKAHVIDWVREQRGRYWDFAGRVARCSDDRWSHVVLHWIPDGARHVGAPCKRWRDDVAKFCRESSNEHWEILAQDVHTWHALRDRFIETAVI